MIHKFNEGETQHALQINYILLYFMLVTAIINTCKYLHFFL